MADEVKINFGGSQLDITGQKERMLQAHERWANENLPSSRERRIYMDRVNKTLNSIYSGISVDLYGKNAYGNQWGRVGSDGASQWADNNTYSMLQLLAKQQNPDAATDEKTQSAAATTESSETTVAKPATSTTTTPVRNTVNYIYKYFKERYGNDVSNVIRNQDMSDSERMLIMLEAAKYGLTQLGRSAEISDLEKLDWNGLRLLCKDLAAGEPIVDAFMPEQVRQTGSYDPKRIPGGYQVIEGKKTQNGYILCRRRDGSIAVLDTTKTDSGGRNYQEVSLDQLQNNTVLDVDSEGTWAVYRDADGNIKVGNLSGYTNEDEIPEAIRNYRMDNSSLGVTYSKYNNDKASLNTLLQQIGQILGQEKFGYADISESIVGLDNNTKVVLPEGATGLNGWFDNTRAFVIRKDAKGVPTITEVRLRSNSDGNIVVTDSTGKRIDGLKWRMVTNEKNKPNYTTTFEDFIAPYNQDNSILDMDFFKTTTVGQILTGSPTTLYTGWSPGRNVAAVYNDVLNWFPTKKGGVAETGYNFGNSLRYVDQRVIKVLEENNMQRDMTSPAALQKVAEDKLALQNQFQYAFHYLINRGHLTDDDAYEDEDTRFCAAYTYMLLTTAGFDRLAEAGFTRERVISFAGMLKNYLNNLEAHMPQSGAKEKADAAAIVEANTESLKNGGKITFAREGVKFFTPTVDTEVARQAIGARDQVLGELKERANAPVTENDLRHNARVGASGIDENGKWNVHDVLSVGAGLLDVGSFIGGVPGAFFALGATALDLINDATNEEVSTAETLKRFGMNLGLSALCLIPGLAGAKAATKTGKAMVRGAKAVTSLGDNVVGANRILKGADDVVKAALKAGATNAEAAKLARQALKEGRRFTAVAKDAQNGFKLVNDLSSFEKTAQIITKYGGKAAQYAMLTAGTATGAMSAYNVIDDAAQGKGADVDDLRGLIGLAGGMKAAKDIFLRKAIRSATKGVKEIDGLLPSLPAATTGAAEARVKFKGNKTAIVNDIIDANGHAVLTADGKIKGLTVGAGETNEQAVLRHLREVKGKVDAEVSNLEATRAGLADDAARTAWDATADGKRLDKLRQSSTQLDNEFLGKNGSIELETPSKIGTAARETGEKVKGFFSEHFGGERDEVRVLRSLDELAGKTGATKKDLSWFQRKGYDAAKKSGINTEEQFTKAAQLAEQHAVIRGKAVANEAELGKSNENLRGVLNDEVAQNSGFSTGKSAADNMAAARQHLNDVRTQNATEIAAQNTKKANKLAYDPNDVLNKADAEKAIQTAEKKMAEAQKAVDKYTKASNDLKTEILTAQAELTTLLKKTKPNNTQKKRIAELTNEINTKKAKLTSSLSKLNSATRKLAKYTTERTTSQDLLNTSNTNMQAVDDANQQMIAAADAEITRLTGANDAHQKMLDDIANFEYHLRRRQNFKKYFDRDVDGFYQRRGNLTKHSERDERLARVMQNYQFKDGGSLDFIAVKMYGEGDSVTRATIHNAKSKNDKTWNVNFNKALLARILEIARSEGGVKIGDKSYTLDDLNDMINTHLGLASKATEFGYKIGSDDAFHVEGVKDYQKLFDALGFHTNNFWEGFNGVGQSGDHLKNGKFVGDDYYGDITNTRRVAYLTPEEANEWNGQLAAFNYRVKPMEGATETQGLPVLYVFEKIEAPATGNLYGTGTSMKLSSVENPKEETPKKETPGNEEEVVVNTVSEGPKEEDPGNKEEVVVNTVSEGPKEEDPGNKEKSGATVSTGADFELDSREDIVPNYQYNDYWVREGFPKLALASINNKAVKDVENNLANIVASRKLPYKQNFVKTSSSFDLREKLGRQKEEMLAQYQEYANESSDDDLRMSMLHLGLATAPTYDEAAADMQKQTFDQTYADQEALRKEDDLYNRSVFQQNQAIATGADQMRAATAEQNLNAQYESNLAAMNGYNASIEKLMYKDMERNSNLYKADVMRQYQTAYNTLSSEYEAATKNFKAEEEAEKAYHEYEVMMSDQTGNPVSFSAWLDDPEKGGPYKTEIEKEKKEKEELDRKYSLNIQNLQARILELQYKNPYQWSGMYNHSILGSSPTTPQTSVHGTVSFKRGGTISAQDRAEIERMKQAFQSLRKHADLLEKEAARNLRMAQHVLDGLASRFNEASKVFLK